MLTIILNTIMWIVGLSALIIVTGIFLDEHENNAPLRKELGK